MSELRLEDILINAGTDEFDRITGYAEFPYFHKQIEVICDEGVTAEYAARSIRWLAEVDEAQVREICQYALYYLQDELESTSKGRTAGRGYSAHSGSFGDSAVYGVWQFEYQGSNRFGGSCAEPERRLRLAGG